MTVSSIPIIFVRLSNPIGNPNIVHNLLNPFLRTLQVCKSQITLAGHFRIRQDILIGVNIVVHFRFYQLCLAENRLQANLVILKKFEVFWITFFISQAVRQGGALFNDSALSYDSRWD